MISKIKKVKPTNLIFYIAFVGLLTLLIFYHLNEYPTPWFDEGFHLLAAKKLALEGKYRFGPAIGPTVFFPVAFAFRLLGVGLIQARFAVVIYLIVFLIAFFKIAIKFGDKKLAFITLLLLISSPSINLLYNGRQVLGEVPAAAYFVIGLLFWFRSIEKSPSQKRWWALALSGIFLGLSILTKNQFFLLLPAWVFVWVVDRLYYRQLKAIDFILPTITLLAIVITWYAIQRFLFSGGEKLATYNMEEWQGAIQRGIFIFSPTRMMDSIKFMVGQETFYGWVFPAIFFILFKGLQRNIKGLQYAFLIIVTSIWLAWFIFLSVGWPRYAFLPITLSSLFVAKLFYELTNGYRFPIKNFGNMVRSKEMDFRIISQFALLILLGIIIMRPLYARMTEVFGNSNKSPQQMATYISDSLTTADAVLETYDPEICFLSGVKCNFPPSEIMNLAIRYVWYGDDPPSKYYKGSDSPYLLIGPYGKWCSIYDLNNIEKNYTLLKSIGVYDLYQKKASD